MSQTIQIYNHLKSKPITPLEALRKYGCFRLASRINELRNEGIDVKTEMVTKNGKRFAKYYL
jgi:hypothetical protein